MRVMKGGHVKPAVISRAAGQSCHDERNSLKDGHHDRTRATRAINVDQKGTHEDTVQPYIPLWLRTWVNEKVT